MEPNTQLDAAYKEAIRKFASANGITGLDIGFKYVGGARTETTAIRFHVADKRPESSLPADELIPAQIDGIVTDVIQAAYTPATAQRRIARNPLRPGISLSRAGATFGTLGAIVYDRFSDRPCVLSNWHVLADATSTPSVGDAIVQPGTLDGGLTPDDSIATLLRWVLTENADAAVGLLNGDRDIDPAQWETGTELKSAALPLIDEILEKSSLATGVTSGRVDGVGIYHIPYSVGTVQLRGFRIVPTEAGNPGNEEISRSGDSGAVWYRTQTQVGVGLHVAGETDPDPTRECAIACFLPDVLEALQVLLQPVFHSGGSIAMSADQLPFQLCAEDGTPANPADLSPEELKAIDNAIMAFMTGIINLEESAAPDIVAQGAEYTHKLGTHNLPNQYRTHKHGTFDWRVESRWQKIQVSVVFQHPTMDQFVNAAVSCVGAAAVGSAVLTAATSNPGAGLAIFLPGWKACMAIKVGNAVANSINVTLKTQTITGPWSGH